MLNQTSTVPTFTDPITVKLRTSKLRNRRLLRVGGAQAVDPDIYEREEADIA